MLAALRKNDAETFTRYQRRTAETLGGYACIPRSVNTSHKVIDGETDPDVVVLLEFPDEAEFDRWWHSPEYAEVRHLREQSATVLLGVAFNGEVNIPGPAPSCAP
jgi:uncharacterized protein (DUF1330 family)